MPVSILDNSLRDLSDAVDDFQQAVHQNAPSILLRFLVACDAEPLAGFLRANLPQVDFDTWMEATFRTRRGMVGSGTLAWPPDRAERVALQILLLRHLGSDHGSLLRFTHDYSNAGYNDISAHFWKFGEIVLSPLLRDLTRLAENRVVPPVLFDAMGALPASGDVTLDALLRAAIASFRDPAPAGRQAAVEKLWDAWERLKTLDVAENKRVSVAILLDQVAPEPEFRALLEREAHALTSIGNAFHIRHFETDKIPLTRASHGDYLFHRLFAFIHLALYTRGSSAR